MPFMKGTGAVRRTLQFLEKGEIILRNDVRILTFGFSNVDKWMLYPTDYQFKMKQKQIEKEGPKFPRHQGLYKFVYWHLPQLKYKNPRTQMLTFKNMTPTPWIRAYLDDDTQIVVDCDDRSREEIHEHVKKVLGKSESMLDRERFARERLTKNPANFGYDFERQCMCEIPGQVACPGWQPLPRDMTGKWKMKMKQEAEQS